jgi:ribosomal protein L35
MSNASVLRHVRPKETRDSIRDLLKAGWTMKVTGSKHLKLTHPNGTHVITSSTSSDWRSHQNFLRQVRQAERGERIT